jgi:hypothetical protein
MPARALVRSASVGVAVAASWCVACSAGRSSSTGAAPSGGASPEAGLTPGDSGSVDASTASWTARQIANPPTYFGTVDDAAGCTTTYRTYGFEPEDATPARHPLFLYFGGTVFVPPDPSAAYDNQAAHAVTNAMARRGFVAISVEYDNGPVAWLSDHENQMACLFDARSAGTLLSAACALPRVDCDLGIATWGHSQGGLLADLAATKDSRVRAAWTTGYGGDSRATLPRSRLRVVNGEGDTGNAVVASIDRTAGFTLAECPDDGRKQCLRADGSGWIIVQKKDCGVSSADHCWFNKKTCIDGAETIEPNWTDPQSTKPFALESNADWVLRTLERP